MKRNSLEDAKLTLALAMSLVSIVISVIVILGR